MKIKNILKISISIIFIGTVFIYFVFLILNAKYPLNLPQISYSKIIKSNDNSIASITLTQDGSFRLQHDKLPKKLIKTTLFFEDKYFYDHNGINIFSLFRAFLHNITHKNRIGGSTISMQVIRMLYPKERNYKSKIIDIFQTLQLENKLSKDQILSLYFNIAPYGGNIYGIKAASLAYFNKEINNLSTAQIALLSTIPKNPNKNRLDRSNNLNLRKKRALIPLLKAKIIDKNEYKRAIEENFIPKKYPLINIAPQYSQLVLANNKDKKIISSNLDKNIQKILHSTLNINAQNIAKKGVLNLSGIIIDNKKMSVVAYVGSHDQNAPQGQNAAHQMQRNVGSTLKPIIYSLALDNGLITPKTLLIDSKAFYENYAPQNYAKDINGLISASDALALSLNIPAIRLNEKLKENDLYSLLSKIKQLKPKEYYGAGIALGTVEMNIVDLAHIYTAYANEGLLKELEFAGIKLRAENKFKNTKEIQLFSKQSAYLTSQMLLNSPAHTLIGAQSHTNAPKISLKTGTSPEGKDLYAIGFDKAYTIAVWAGNFNANATDGATGLKDVSPIVFQIFNQLSINNLTEKIKQPKGLHQEQVCVDIAESEKCKNIQTDWLIDGVKLKNKCELLRQDEIDYLASIGELESIKCDFSNHPPLITGVSKSIIATSNLSQIFIKCYSFNQKNIWIQLDEQNWKKYKSAQPVELKILPGEHEIKCMDTQSNLSSIKIQIKEIQ